MNKNIILGLVIVVLGVVVGLNSLDIVDINIFFQGWWTLFIIIPSLCGLINQKDTTGNLIGLTIGTLLLLAARDVIEFDIIWKLIFPLIIIITGLSIIFKDVIAHKTSEKIKKLNAEKTKSNEINAMFAEQKIDYDNEAFEGAEINSVFGSTRLDLRNAKIKKDTLINVSNIFGETTVLVPANMKVVSKPVSLFGRETNHHKKNDKESSIVIYINSTNIFGGVTIK